MLSRLICHGTSSTLRAQMQHRRLPAVGGTPGFTHFPLDQRASHCSGFYADQCLLTTRRATTPTGGLRAGYGRADCAAAVPRAGDSRADGGRAGRAASEERTFSTRLRRLSVRLRLHSTVYHDAAPTHRQLAEKLRQLGGRYGGRLWRAGRVTCRRRHDRSGEGGEAAAGGS